MSMVKNRYYLFLTVLFLIFLSWNKGITQPYSTLELKKPPQYETRDLAAEKTSATKFSGSKRFFQNTVTHFNYYFNARNKIKEILEKAKSGFQEDYTQLLPFYNYTLDNVSKNKDQLDSVIYKCTAGILLHDLRTDWVDDLYLLMGQAYLFKKNYDSAAQVFQYINYAFAPKDGGYDIPIGSNASNTGGEFTVVTKESKSVWKKLTTEPPGRNESFLWRIRTYLEQNQISEAAGLIEILVADPNFPKRLQPFLHELSAYRYYKENSPDSAAWHLGRSMEQAVTRQEKARWNFLIGQLYTQTGKDSLAVLAYRQAIKTAVDPTLEVYAHLAISALESGKKVNAVQQNLDELIKMGKRPLYEGYRDIIYYAAAKLEIKQQHPDQAQYYLLKSIQYNLNNNPQKQESFLLLADLNYDRKAYTDAYRFYDSLQVTQLKEIDQARVIARKPALKTITENITAINREDSLQKLALMPIDERNAFLKNKLKQLRKEAGIREQEGQEPSFGIGNVPLKNLPEPDLFSTGSTDFYFQNASLKSKGFAEFKVTWGNRPNIDNWRRQSAVEKSFTKANGISTTVIDQKSADKNAPATTAQELTLASLQKDLPLTNEKMSASYLIVLNSLLANGSVFQNQLNDYPSAIEVYRTIVNRFPDISETEKALFNLANCYERNNQPVQADSVRKILNTYFAGGVYTKLMQKKGTIPQKDPATVAYANIYDSFVAGNFKEALEAKQKADKIYGDSHWTAQQLYIESIYYVKNLQDSIAINRLQEIIKRYPKSTLVDKATTMINVLKRRKEIENYLTNLTIEKQEETIIRPVDLDTSNTIKTKVPFKSEALIKQTPKELKVTEKVAPVKPAIIASSGYSFNAADSQYVALFLDNVDAIFASEGKNAFNRYNRENYYNQPITMGSVVITAQQQLILMGPFANAAEAVGYINKTKPMAATRIIPWLAANKYRFTIISNSNLNILKNSKDIAAYHSFMHGIFPDIF